MSAGARGMTDDRFVLAFYGVKPSSEAIERFFNFTVSWFTRLGFPPNRLGVAGEGYSKKKGTFSRGMKKLESLGFSAVEAFDLDALMPEDVCGSRHFAAASFARGMGSSQYGILSVPSSCMACDRWRSAAREVIDCLEPAYGIAFGWPLTKGPIFYAMGINFGQVGGIATGDEYDRRRSISRWSDIGMRKEVYREGLLRYVYRWNFLTKLQLERQVEGVSLARWIAADAWRGQITSFSGDMWLWEVDEVQLAAVRRRLHDAERSSTGGDTAMSSRILRRSWGDGAAK